MKSPNKGKRKENLEMHPVTTPDDRKLNILRNFAIFVQAWKSNYPKSGLTKQTTDALIWTCSGTADLCASIIAYYRFNFVLTGRLQSDSLEKHFGRYRQLSAANYFISVRKLFEAENEIRMTTLLKSVYRISEIKDFVFQKTKVRIKLV